MPDDPQHNRPTPDWGLAPVSVPAADALTIDIVLVHGLNSSRTKPWTSRQDDFWPSWIVQDLPGARVWVYGYNSSVWLTGSNDHLLIHAVKFLESMANAKVGLKDTQDGQKPIPVVLIGHSLGGVLIKQALITSHARSDLLYSYLFDITVLVCFCGTPHRGSIWANRLYALSFSQAPALVRLLRRRTAYGLPIIAGKFNSIWGDRRVLTFIEKRSVPLLGLIVKPQDAQTNCVSENLVEIEKDHREMVRVDTREDLLYKTLIEQFRRASESTPSTRNLPATLSNPRNDTRLLSANPTIRPMMRKFLLRELCLPPWETRIYTSGDMDFGSDHSAAPEPAYFDGGSFYYQWPPGSDTCILLIVDLTTFTFSWTITSPASMYYPGRHSGKLQMPRSDDYPFKGPSPRFSTPILCPFVAPRLGYLSPAYGTWADIWSPAMGLHHILTSLAAFIHFGPHLEHMPQALAADIRFPFHPFNPRTDSPVHMTMEPWFRLATNFFCRVYTLNADGGEEGEEDLPADEDMMAASIQAISGLFEHALDINRDPVELTPERWRGDHSLEEIFSVERITTRKQWQEEEKLWAEALDMGYRVIMNDS